MSTNADTARLVEELVQQLNQGYIFPERAARAAELLRARSEEGAYAHAAGAELCECISADLFEACDDKHLRLIWHETPVPAADETELHARMREQIRRENYGVRQVKLLDGNVGVIELTIIPEASTGGPSLAAAMHLIQNTAALIFDLRDTRGGSPDGVAFLSSYMFADGEIHLSDLIEGPNGPLRQYWTSSYVPGARYLDRPVFVLASSATFSRRRSVRLRLTGARTGDRCRRDHSRRSTSVRDDSADGAGRAAPSRCSFDQHCHRRQLGSRWRPARHVGAGFASA